MRVCVVGAGAAGLGAARELRTLGVEAVTVLERSDRVGGKCCTISHEGRSYELGAGALTRAYRNVRELLLETGIEAQPKTSGLFVDVETGTSSFLPPSLRVGGWLRACNALLRLKFELSRNARLYEPGFAGVSRELDLPFEEWCRRKDLLAAARLIEPWFTAFGYGYFHEIPAAYVLKYATYFGFPLFEITEAGYGGLWERVARGLDVRLGVEIERITRDGIVRVTTQDGTLEFDALVLACPLDDALRFLDATPEEAGLFSRIRYYDYHVIAAFAEGLPRARWMFVPGHFAPSHAAWPMFGYRRWADRDLVLFYSLLGSSEPADAEANLHATAARLGGRIRGIHLARTWRFFPHVTPADMDGGYYEAVEALQGQRRSYYTGELLAFSCVEAVVAYSRALMGRFFG